MKRLYIAIIALALALAGCTQFNGHLGPLFGSWSLVELTEDSMPIDVAYETIFSFQNKVVRILRHVNPPLTSASNYGEFTMADDVLTLQFMATPTPTGSGMYMAPDWLHFPQGGVPIHMDVIKLSGSEMVLSLDNDGKTYVYSFRKTW